MSDTLPPIAVTPEQAQAMPEADRATARALYAQHYEPAAVERVFGAAPVQDNAAAAAAQQREAELDSTYAAPADGSEYKLNYGPVAQASDIAELAALNGDVSTAFAAASVPSALAQPLLDAILETGELYASESMTDAGRELRWREEGALFKKISPNPAEDLRLANLAYRALPRSFREQLDSSYALHSAKAQLQLAAVGRAIEYRAGKKK